MREGIGDQEHPGPRRGGPLGRVPSAPVSWWWRDAGGCADPSPRWTGDHEVDVAIVGGGLAALWVAELLTRRHPQQRLAVITDVLTGAGSALDGTGCATPLPDLLDAAGNSPDLLDAFAFAADRFVAATELIDVHAVDAVDAAAGPPAVRRGPTVAIAEDRPELARLGSSLRNARRNGLTEDRLAWLEPVPGVRRPALSGALGMVWLADGLAMHPGRLARALLAHLSAAGVIVARVGAVRHVGPREVVTDTGTVTAGSVVCAGFDAVAALLPDVAAGLTVARRLHLVSEPVDELTWSRLGWPVGQVVVLQGEDGFVQAQHEGSGRLVWSWWPSNRGRGLLRRRAGVDRTGDLLRGLAARLPAGVRAPAATTWAHDVVVSAPAATGRDSAGGVWWVVAEHDDPLIELERAVALTDRLARAGALGG